MKTYDVQQGTPEWLALRAGRPTASQFHRILTPKGLKLSEQAGRYMDDLLAEWMMGRPLEEKSFPSLLHGKETEEEAVRFFEFERDVESYPIGFVTNDEGTIGASPDRGIGDDELLEVKCPDEPGVHVGYLRARKGGVSAAYMLQLQGQLWVCQRKAVTILSYHREMPPAIVRVERDDEYIETLSAVVTGFAERLAAAKAELEFQRAPIPY